MAFIVMPESVFAYLLLFLGSSTLCLFKGQNKCTNDIKRRGINSYTWEIYKNKAAILNT